MGRLVYDWRGEGVNGWMAGRPRPAEVCDAETGEVLAAVSRVEFHPGWLATADGVTGAAVVTRLVFDAAGRPTLTADGADVLRAAEERRVRLAWAVAAPPG